MSYLLRARVKLTVRARARVRARVRVRVGAAPLTPVSYTHLRAHET